MARVCWRSRPVDSERTDIDGLDMRSLNLAVLENLLCVIGRHDSRVKHGKEGGRMRSAAGRGVITVEMTTSVGRAAYPHRSRSSTASTTTRLGFRPRRLVSWGLCPAPPLLT
jgi:hypothetical protein